MKFFSSGSSSIALALTLAAGALLLQGCATQLGGNSGAGNTEAAAEPAPDYSYIVKGSTTKTQLVAKLGRPTSSTVASTGGETLIWGSSVTSIDPKSYIPYIGSLIGGGKTKTKVLTVNVDKKGVVTDHKFESGTQELKMGL